MERSTPDACGPQEVYRPRNPRAGAYYQCVESHFEELEQIWEDRYAPRFGFWRPYIMEVIYRYLDCGDLRCGFARVKCSQCSHEFLVGYSCKRRHLCPSCHQKRVVEYGEWLLTHVLKAVPHRQWVFSIPKRLRIYFMYDRKLLAKYIVRACFSQQRMAYIPMEKSTDGVAKVIYTSRDGRSQKTFDALDWLALLVTHIPGRYEQTVRYYGYYSNKSRGLRKKAHSDDQLPPIAPGEISSKAFRRNRIRPAVLRCLHGPTRQRQNGFSG